MPFDFSPNTIMAIAYACIVTCAAIVGYVMRVAIEEDKEKKIKTLILFAVKELVDAERKAYKMHQMDRPEPSPLTPEKIRIRCFVPENPPVPDPTPVHVTTREQVEAVRKAMMAVKDDPSPAFNSLNEALEDLLAAHGTKSVRSALAKLTWKDGGFAKS